MTKKSYLARLLWWIAERAVLAFPLVASSCLKSDRCPSGPQIEREMYFGFDDSNTYTGSAECFGPSADCSVICAHLNPPMTNGWVARVVVCERVPAPDGWADAGYRAWEDAGYETRTSSSDVDPTRILHVVFIMEPFCGV